MNNNLNDQESIKPVATVAPVDSEDNKEPKPTSEDLLKIRIEELRKRDPFIYR